MRHVITAVAGVLTGAALAAGVTLAVVPHGSGGPAACSHPSQASGDAMVSGGHERVCTDGVWVSVTHYGN